MTINVMIVDDSIFIRAILKQIIESDPQKRFKVVASAKDGKDAIEKINLFNVDVITMDVEMPVKNGIEAVSEIMCSKPTPIIMLSSLTKRGAKETIEALSLGAVDFITKPVTHSDFVELKKEIYIKLDEAYKSRNRIAKNKYKKEFKKNNIEEKPKSEKKDKLTNLIVIGCSTGGPRALQKIASLLPSDFPMGIVVVQHMPVGSYIESLANHLNNISSFHIKEAKHGLEIKDGMMIIAPGGQHLELLNRMGRVQVVLNNKDLVSGHRPSVDVMFKSASLLNNKLPVFGVVLTGMGSDGTAGAADLKKSGAKVIAESEETATIYGMPKQVINKGLADFVVDLDNIVHKLTELTKN